MNPFITFIIPTIGRPSLRAAIGSLINQVHPDWQAIVIGDHVEPHIWQRCIVSDRRIVSINLAERLGHDNVGAEVRNRGLQWLKEGIMMPDWVGNLDDDDTLTPDYILKLVEDGKDVDLLQFRAEWENKIDIRPIIGETRLLPATVSNAFAFRYDFAERHNLHYIDSTSEDWATIQSFISAGARCKVSDHVTYRVRH